MKREISFKSGNVRLEGTLAIPDNHKEGKLPAFVLVHGSGPNDRNENADLRLMSPKMKERQVKILKNFNLEPRKFKLNVFNRMSDHLVGEGFIVLRYDKRGVGKSSGDYKKAGFKDLISDVHAAVRFLRSQPEVDPAKIVVLGHSEGGIIGPVACMEDPTIAGLVICAGTSQKLDDIIIHQARYAKKMMEQLTPEQKKKLDIKEEEDPVEKAQEMIAKVKRGDEYVEIDDEKIYAKWFREHFEHDPLEMIKKVKCPVLIVQGEKDFQVPYTNAIALKEALEKAGNTGVRLLLFPNIDHLLKFEPYQSSELRYIQNIDREVEPLILESISSWAKSVLAGTNLI